MNVIKGLVTTGSYIGCNVIILNEGFLTNGKIRIKSYSDICKYNVCFIKKPLKCEGKKMNGQTTYLNKESILIQPNCRCKDDSCMMSHIEEKEVNLPLQFNPYPSPLQPSPLQPSPLQSSPLQSSPYPNPYPRHYPSPYPSPYPHPQFVDFDTLLNKLYQKYINHPGKSSIINIQIAYQNLKSLENRFTQESYTNSFICVASLSLRVLLENYCKEISNNNYSTARELVYLLYSNGYFTHDQEKFACEILSFTNNIIHSCKDIGNHSLSIEKLKNGLLFLLSLNKPV